MRAIYIMPPIMDANASCITRTRTRTVARNTRVGILAALKAVVTAVQRGLLTLAQHVMTTKIVGAIPIPIERRSVVRGWMRRRDTMNVAGRIIVIIYICNFTYYLR